MGQLVELRKHENAQQESVIAHDSIRADVGAGWTARAEQPRDGRFDLFPIVLLEQPHRFVFSSRLTFLCDGDELSIDYGLDPFDIAGGADKTSWRVRRHQCAGGCRHAEDRDDARMCSEEMKQAGAAKCWDIHSKTFND